MKELYRLVGFLRPYMPRMIGAAVMLAISGILMAVAISTVKPLVNNVFLPAAHVSAWVSTLQAGTHALFILEGLSPEDLDGELDLTADPEKQISMMRLSILQEILVRLIDD